MDKISLLSGIFPRKVILEQIWIMCNTFGESADLTFNFKQLLLKKPGPSTPMNHVHMIILQRAVFAK